MRLLASVVVLLIASPSFAQSSGQGSGPSFDCAKASNAVERTICKEPELARADREMTAAYTALAGRLSGAAKDALVKGQVRWIGERNEGCGTDTDGIAPCLKKRYAARTANLKAFGQGTYPFISEQSLIRSGKLGEVSWSYDIAYPQFDGATADFSAVNARFANAAKKAAADATPKSDSGVDREQEWTYDQSFTIQRPGASAVTIALDFYGYSGGAHGYGATRCTLVDLRTGKEAGPQAVFADGDQWLTTMVQLVGVDLKKQFVQNPGFDDALQPASLAKLLREPSHWCWGADELELVFNAYDVGPYAAGPYEVTIPYERLKPLLRADGPVAR